MPHKKASSFDFVCSDLEDFIVLCCQTPFPNLGTNWLHHSPYVGPNLDETLLRSVGNKPMRPFIQTCSPHFFRLGDLVQESEK